MLNIAVKRYTVRMLIMAGTALLLSGCGKPTPEPVPPTLKTNDVEIGETMIPPTNPVATRQPLLTVGTNSVSESDIQKEMKKLVRIPENRPIPMKPETFAYNRLREQAKEQLIRKHIVLQAARELELDVTEEEIDHGIKILAEQMEKRKQSLDQLLAQTGQTQEQLRKEMRTQLLLEKLYQKQLRRSVIKQPSEVELRQYYQSNIKDFQIGATVRARHIQINIPEHAPDNMIAERKAFAQSLRDRTADGELIAKLAGEFSECPSKQRGGDLGQANKVTLTHLFGKPFAEEAFKLETNTLSQVIESRNAFHVILVEERHPSRIRTYDEVKGHLPTLYIAAQRRNIINKFEQKLREQADVQLSEAEKARTVPLPPAYPGKQ